jgi:DNA polymerase-3 subunit alpha
MVSDRPASGSAERGFFGGRPATIAGYVHEVRKRGNRNSILLDDRTGRIEVTFFEEVFQQHRELLAKDALLLVEGQLRFDEFGDAWRLAAKRVSDLDRAREQQAHRIFLSWPRGADARLVPQVEALLAAAKPGPCPVSIRYRGPAGEATLDLGAEWRVRASRALIEGLEALLGSDTVRVVFAPLPGPASSALG